MRKGVSILSVAKVNGIPIHYECDGNCTCGTCHVIVEKGMENLTPIASSEEFHLRQQNLPSNCRLSCQARLLGDVIVKVYSSSP